MSDTTYLGEHAVYPCAVDGKLAHPATAPGFVGTQYGTHVAGLVVWSEAKGVVAGVAA